MTGQQVVNQTVYFARFDALFVFPPNPNSPKSTSWLDQQQQSIYFTIFIQQFLN